MGSWGVRLAPDNVDAATGADKDMALTSKYALLKGSLSGSGTVSVDRDATETVVTIAHGLSHIPIVQAFVNDPDGIIINPSYYYPIPTGFLVEDLGTTTFFVCRARADATNVYLTFTIEDF